MTTTFTIHVACSELPTSSGS